MATVHKNLWAGYPTWFIRTGTSGQYANESLDGVIKMSMCDYAFSDYGLIITEPAAYELARQVFKPDEMKDWGRINTAGMPISPMNSDFSGFLSSPAPP